MAKLSQLTIPVKNPSTGAVTPQTFDLAGSGGGGSDTNYIGTKTDYDALPSSEKAKYNSMDFTDYHDGLNIDPTPMINSKNPVASGGVYAALQNVNSEIEDLHSDVTDAAELVAPLESTLVASRAYAIGDQFVYNGFLYKVTAAIPFDSAIVIGTNCELASCVTEQINEIANVISMNVPESVNIVFNSTYINTVYSMTAYKIGKVLFVNALFYVKAQIPASTPIFHFTYSNGSTIQLSNKRSDAVLIPYSNAPANQGLAVKSSNEFIVNGGAIVAANYILTSIFEIA